MLNRHKLMGLFVVLLTVSWLFPLLGSTFIKALPTEKGFTPSQFEWTTYNRDMNVTTIVSPDGSRDALWELLQSADESIYVEIYGINNPYILDLIHEIHDDKPALEMKFLIGWNSLGYHSPNEYVANNLTELGYEVRWTNASDFTFAHQKFFVIDNETAVVHSGNWAKTSFPEEGKKANREWSIAMTDVQVAGYYLDVFDYDWSRGTEYDAGTHGTGDPLSYSQVGTTYMRPFTTPGKFSGQMNVTPIFSPDTSLEGILYCINSAQATLDIQIPYFTSVGDEGAVDEILDAIIAAKNRGVTVRVISEEVKDWIEVAEILIEHEIPIVWQMTRWFSANHNKAIIVDGRIVLISSINYSDGSITRNREAGVIIENDEVAQWYLDVYDFDWSVASWEELDEVNLYWDPNIPNHEADITVTVYAHMLNATPVDEVWLDYRVGASAWNNISIIDNLANSEEGNPENYFYVIPAQPDGTDITVVGRIRVGSTWHVGLPMVIRVRDSIGSATTTTTTADSIHEFLVEFGVYIVLIVIAVVCGGGYKTYSKRR